MSWGVPGRPRAPPGTNVPGPPPDPPWSPRTGDQQILGSTLSGGLFERLLRLFFESYLGLWWCFGVKGSGPETVDFSTKKQHFSLWEQANLCSILFGVVF